MDKITQVALTLLLLLLSLGSAASNLEKVSIELKWLHQFQFAGIYMAKEKGFYQDVGLDVDIIERDIKSNPAKDVLSGKVQFGVIDSSIIQKRLEGKKLIILAAIYQHSPLVLISLSEKKIYSPLELKNKKVMYQKGVDDAIIISMFTSQGIKEKDFTFVPHNFKTNALLTGKADAMSAYLGNQTFYYQQQGKRLNIINPSNYGLDLYGDMLFTSQEYFIKNKQQSLAFKNATIKGWKYALSHPEEAVDTILKKYSQRKSRAALLHEAKHTASMIAHNLIDIGHVNKDRVMRIKDAYQQWLPELRDKNIDGLFYFDHLEKKANQNWLIVISIVVILSILTFISVFYAIKWRRKEQLLQTKYSSTSKKLESFQDVIMHKFDTTLTNLNAEITFISDSMLDNLGYQRGELLGQSKIKFYAAPDPTALHKLIRRSIKQHGLWQGELKLRAKNGSTRTYDCLVDEYIERNGKLSGYISVHIDQTDKKVAEKRAKTDALTAIANRYSLDQKLRDEMKRSDRYGNTFSVLLFDIDHFKQINDEFGHIVGDKVIQMVANVLKNNIREVDLVGRWGGEEFLVICPELDIEGAYILANKLREKVAQLQFSDISHVHISGGVASHKHQEDIFTMIERADNALYQAKHSGRNRICKTEPEVPIN